MYFTHRLKTLVSRLNTLAPLSTTSTETQPARKSIKKYLPKVPFLKSTSFKNFEFLKGQIIYISNTNIS